MTKTIATPGVSREDLRGEGRSLGSEGRSLGSEGRSLGSQGESDASFRRAPLTYQLWGEKRWAQDHFLAGVWLNCYKGIT